MPTPPIEAEAPILGEPSELNRNLPAKGDESMEPGETIDKKPSFNVDDDLLGKGEYGGGKGDTWIGGHGTSKGRLD